MKDFTGEFRGWLGVAALPISPGYDDDEASGKPTNAELFAQQKRGTAKQSTLTNLGGLGGLGFGHCKWNQARTGARR